jgi:5-oxoprolinase (ATP-hydrolysing) subunit A
VSRIDFNCDLGEGCGDDSAIIPMLSSASIACGGHAGDADSMRATVELCRRHGVAVGAHPSFEDREHFGRREQSLAATEVRALVARQVAALASVCAAAGVRLGHVKPHGALYNLAAREPEIALAVAAAVRAHDPTLVLYALSGSELARAGTATGLHVAHEVFAERRYEADGSLTPRSRPDAIIADVAEAVAQVEGVLEHGRIVARTGESVPLRADTVCLHGDRPDALAFARALHDALLARGVRIVAAGRT